MPLFRCIYFFGEGVGFMPLFRCIYLFLYIIFYLFFLYFFSLLFWGVGGWASYLSLHVFIFCGGGGGLYASF